MSSFKEETVYVIPDTQIRPGVKNPLIAVAKHIATIRPTYILHLGDHWDLPSLSQYDKGKKSHRVRSYLNDQRAGNLAMAEFFEVLDERWSQHKKKCKKIILKGNHEERRTRALEYGPDELVDLINEFPLDYTGWDKVIPFLKIHKIKGISFCHYFSNEFSGRPHSTAQQILNKKHSSGIAGHKQGFNYAEAICDGSKMIQSLIIGSCYYHKEEYKGHNNHHWRGTVLLKNIRSGMFDFDRFALNSLDKIK